MCKKYIQIYFYRINVYTLYYIYTCLYTWDRRNSEHFLVRSQLICQTQLGSPKNVGPEKALKSVIKGLFFIEYRLPWQWRKKNPSFLHKQYTDCKIIIWTLFHVCHKSVPKCHVQNREKNKQINNNIKNSKKNTHTKKGSIFLEITTNFLGSFPLATITNTPEPEEPIQSAPMEPISRLYFSNKGVDRQWYFFWKFQILVFLNQKMISFFIFFLRFLFSKISGDSNLGMVGSMRVTFLEQFFGFSFSLAGNILFGILLPLDGSSTQTLMRFVVKVDRFQMI